MDFSTRLRELRTEKGISQKKLADLAGISQASIFYWEKGTRKPKLEQLYRIASALGVSPNEFFSPGEQSLIEDMTSLYLNMDFGTGITEVEKLSPQTPQENYLIIRLRELNEKGRTKVVDYADDLSKIKEYTEKEGK